MKAFAKLTRVTAEGRRTTPDPPLITPLADLLTDPAEAGREEELRSVVRAYARPLQPEHRHLLRHYRLVVMASKVVGVASVGTRCWALLLLARDEDDPLLLRAKGASESVLAAHTGGERYDHRGRGSWPARDFHARQLGDWTGIARPETMGPVLLSLFARLPGACLAAGARARSGDPVTLASYLGGSDRFDGALTEFAQSYAGQNERGHETVRAACRSGRATAARL
ncbi:hypothetical protein KE639_06611 [Streptomyces sp. V17-9]|nr:hypothetical protein KE639_06611 [Streptomyces sp. V17-9]